MAQTLAFVAAVALVLALPACGGEDEDPGGDEPSPRTALVIVVQPEGPGGPELEASLECDPPGGTHPDPEAACRALFANRQALEPVAADAICTQLYGGPNRATIRGTLEGREVAAELNRTNGCEIDRWDRLKHLLAIDSA
jgi:hypothetical protein